MKELKMLAWWLMVLGAVNWGLIGLFDFNVVATLLGSGSLFEKLVNVVIGASAVYVITQHKKK